MECLVTGKVLTEIADKLRSVNSTSRTYTLSEMASAISELSIQASPRLIERTATAYTNDVVSYIGSYAFHSYTTITQVGFANASIVYTNAFDNCVALSMVSLPKVEMIYENAFDGCSSISSIDLPMASIIGSSAFINCTKLQMATLNVATAISESAFANCQKLASLYLLGSTVATITNSSVFLSTPMRNSSYLSGSYGSIFVPESLVSAYKAAAGWSTISARITAYIPSE